MISSLTRIVVTKEDSKIIKEVCIFPSRTKLKIPISSEIRSGAKINLYRFVRLPFPHGITGATDMRSISNKTFGKLTVL